MQRLVFSRQPRGVPHLGRGWRTPDPSPSRSAAALPSCSGRTFELTYEGPAATNCNFDFEPLPRCRSQKNATAHPSAPHSSKEKASSAAHRLRTRAHRLRTPSPDALVYESNVRNNREKLSMPYKATNTDATMDERGTPRDRLEVEMRENANDSEKRIELSLSQALGQLLPPPPPSCFTRQHRPSPQPRQSLPEGRGNPAEETEKLSLASLLDLDLGQPPPAARTFQPQRSVEESSETEDIFAPSASIVSIGSVGHPMLCKKACKYAPKSKGCKDGYNCNHCHLCAWKSKPGSRKTRLKPLVGSDADPTKPSDADAF